MGAAPDPLGAAYGGASTDLSVGFFHHAGERFPSGADCLNPPHLWEVSPAVEVLGAARGVMPGSLGPGVRPKLCLAQRSGATPGRSTPQVCRGARCPAIGLGGCSASARRAVKLRAALPTPAQGWGGPLASARVRDAAGRRGGGHGRSRFSWWWCCGPASPRAASKWPDASRARLVESV